jgi:hypothetical protein
VASLDSENTGVDKVDNNIINDNQFDNQFDQQQLDQADNQDSKRRRFIPRKRKEGDIPDNQVNPDDVHIEERKESTQTPKLGSIMESSPSNIDEFSSSSMPRIIPNSQNKSIAELNRYNNEINLN